MEVFVVSSLSGQNPGNERVMRLLLFQELLVLVFKFARENEGEKVNTMKQHGHTMNFNIYFNKRENLRLDSKKSFLTAWAVRNSTSFNHHKPNRNLAESPDLLSCEYADGD